MSIVTVSANLDISALNVFIAQQEQFLRGELTSIENKGDVIVLEFNDADGVKPQTPTVVTTGKPPPNTKVIGMVRTFAGREPALGIAFRQGVGN